MPIHHCSSCGNGEIDSDEQCDDGNFISIDECDQCVSTTCGDGVIQGITELCDDNNTLNGDGCASDCIIIETGWTCYTQDDAEWVSGPDSYCVEDSDDNTNVDPDTSSVIS